MAPANDRRKIDRRFTDQEIEEILEYSRGYVNGAKTRQKYLATFITLLVSITTLINFWIVSPIKEDMSSLRHEIMEIDNSVRKHHEEQAAEYVSKEDEKKVYAEIQTMEKKLDRIVEYVLSGKK